MYSREYQEIAVLNRGSYGTVSLIEDRRQGHKYAAKRLRRGKWWCKCHCRNEARHELKIRSILGEHQNILRLEQVRSDNVLVYEFCPRGDLYEAIRRGDIKPQAVRTVMTQLCDVVQYCHDHNVYHRDIKPENILVGPQNCFKLADFGLACVGRWCSDFGTGSEGYMAPECFNSKGDKKYDAKAADIWSLGVCLLNVLFGRCPWKQANTKDRIFSEYLDSRECLFDNFAHLSRDVFNALMFALRPDPSQRDLQKFRAAIQEVEVWTTKEELARLSLTECVPLPHSIRVPSLKNGSRPPLPLPTPHMHMVFSSDDEDGDQDTFVWGRSSSLSSSDNSHTIGVFDFDEDIKDTMVRSPGPLGSNGIPELNVSPSTTDTISEPHQPDFASSVPLPNPTSCSWADLDEEFYPHSTSKWDLM